MSTKDRPTWLAGRIAVLMARLPGQCWPDLYTWAADTWRERWDRGDGWRGLLPWAPSDCHRDADFQRCGACWCGKNLNPETRARIDAAVAASRHS